jgi:SAM-dependent methyltransferase
MLDSVKTPISAADPLPAEMQVDMADWTSKLHASNFANTYAQYRDVTELGEVRRILVIGPGQGLDTAVFRWLGFEVETFDIDDRLSPDHIGSAHDLSMFSDKAFDVVIASHVLEHLPPAYLDRAIAEIARVAHHALIYLPLAGARASSLRLMPGLRGWDWTVALRFFNPFAKPDPRSLRFCGGQHYWEVGRPGYTKADVIRRFEGHFAVRKVYRNPDWVVSINYVLTAR